MSHKWAIPCALTFDQKCSDALHRRPDFLHFHGSVFCRGGGVISVSRDNLAGRLSDHSNRGDFDVLGEQMVKTPQGERKGKYLIQ